MTPSSHPDLRVRYRPVAELATNPHNARRHSRAQIATLKKAISEFGFRVPVLIDETDTVLAGHGRLKAACQLGLKSVPTICLEGLSSAQKRAFLLADNRLAEMAQWDLGQLNLELEALAVPECQFDLSVIGFELPSEPPVVPKKRRRPRQLVAKSRSWRVGPHVVHLLDLNDEAALGALLKQGPSQLVTDDERFAERLLALLQAEESALGEQTRFGTVNMRSNVHA